VKGIECVEALLEEADALLQDWEGGVEVVEADGRVKKVLPLECSKVEFELYCGDAVGMSSSTSSSTPPSMAVAGMPSQSVVPSMVPGWETLRGPGLSATPCASLWKDADFAYVCSTCFSEGTCGCHIALSRSFF